MNIVARAKNMLFSPKTEWAVAAAEPATTGQLMTYAAILSAIASVCGLIGGYLTLAAATSMMPGMPQMPFGALIVQAILGWVVGLVVIYVMALIASALAPSFGGQKDNLQGLKLLVYAGTAVWVTGILAIIPVLGWIAILVGYFYAIYLIYLGAPHTVRVPQGKNGGYAAVVVIIWIVLALILSYLVTLVTAPMLGNPMAGAGTVSTY